MHHLHHVAFSQSNDIVQSRNVHQKICILSGHSEQKISLDLPFCVDKQIYCFKKVLTLSSLDANPIWTYSSLSLSYIDRLNSNVLTRILGIHNKLWASDSFHNDVEFFEHSCLSSSEA